MLGIIHFSDIHIEDCNHDILFFESEFKEVFKTLDKVSKVLVIVTGDIVNKGTKEQFEIATDFFGEIKSFLEEKSVEFIFIPGNHDCDLNPKKIENQMRDILLKKIIHRKEELDNETIKVCCNPLMEYFKFENQMSLNSEIETIFEDELLKIKRLKIKEELYIKFICLNTSWMSRLEEVPGELFFPINKYLEKIEESEGDIVFTLFHHPSRWDHPDDAMMFDQSVEEFSDFIFSGHEHNSDVFSKVGIKNTTVYFLSDALNKVDCIERSAFQIIQFDFDNSEYMVQQYDFNSGSYKLKNTIEWTSYKEIVNKKNNLVKLEPYMNSFIKDLGMNLNHPKKENLKLDDVFVYPDLEKRSLDDDKEIWNMESISAKKLIEEKLENLVIIFGEDKYGKTALGRRLFDDFYSDEKLPIYLDIAKISKSKLYSLKKSINQIFNKQYKVRAESNYFEYEEDKRIIIIDNINENFEDEESKLKFLIEVSKLNKQVICLMNNLFEMEEVTFKKIKDRLNVKIDEYRIKKFGYKLRNELINKWNTIGSEFAEYDDEFIVVNEEKARKVELIIGKNYIPSIPFYILVILQASETGNVHSFNDSAYGYYYHYLILETLNKISNNTGTIDAINSFLTRIVYAMKRSGEKSIEAWEFEEEHKKFKIQFGISKSVAKIYDYKELVYELSSNNILKVENDRLRFTYNYIYYYYIAKYYSDNISNTAIKDEIEEMIDKLYIEEYANIIIFIVYMRKDIFIFEKLKNVMGNIFKYKKEVKLEEDLAFVADLQDKLPKDLVINKKKPIEFRKKQLQEKDDFLIKEKKYNKYTEEDSEVIGSIRELNLCFKSMEIAGQILKNYWGSLEREVKKEIGLNIYSVGLRSLAEVFQVLKEAKEIEELITSTIEKKTYKDVIDQVEKVRELIIMFTKYFIQGTVYKISECVGDMKLENMHNEILSELPYNSIKLINLNIKLQYNGGVFPFKEVKELLEENKSNQVVTYLIKHASIQHIYLYKKKPVTIQQISELIDVPIKRLEQVSYKETEVRLSAKRKGKITVKS